ncbi:hypothetical protein KEM54_000012 [Ascosphaera aggregata]|nr:hypothetical protein KEM54_000012 [Ascosphaera aggregata]
MPAGRRSRRKSGDSSSSSLNDRDDAPFIFRGSRKEIYNSLSGRKPTSSPQPTRRSTRAAALNSYGYGSSFSIGSSHDYGASHTEKNSKLGGAFDVSSSSSEEEGEKKPMVLRSVQIRIPSGSAEVSTTGSAKSRRKSEGGSVKPERRPARTSIVRTESSSDPDFNALGSTPGDAVSAFLKKAAPKQEPKSSYVDIYKNTPSSSSMQQEPPFPRSLLTDMSNNTSSIMNLLLPTTSFPTAQIMQKKVATRGFSMRAKHYQTSLDIHRKYFNSAERYIPVDFLRSMFPHAPARLIANIIIKAKLVNLAQLALDIIPQLLNEDALDQDALLELDMQYPAVFVDDMDLALYTGWRRERIIKAAFDFGKVIRLYWLVKALKIAQQKGEITGEGTYNIVRETFYAAGGEEEELDPNATPTKFRGWELAGLAEQGSRPGDPILPEEYIPDVKETIKSVRKLFRKGRLDYKRVKTLFPWENFVVEAVKWVKTLSAFLVDVDWKVKQEFDRFEEEAREARAEKERKEREAKVEREKKERLAEERLRASLRQRGLLATDSTTPPHPCLPWDFSEVAAMSGTLPQPANTTTRTGAGRTEGPAIRPFSSFVDDTYTHNNFTAPEPPGPSFGDLHVSSPAEDEGTIISQSNNGQAGNISTAAPQVTPDAAPYRSAPYAPLIIDDAPNQSRQATAAASEFFANEKPAKSASRKRQTRGKNCRGEYYVSKSGTINPSRKLRRLSAHAESGENRSEKHVPQPPVDTSQRLEDDAEDDGVDELKDAYASFGLALETTPREKQTEQEGLTSTLGWSIGKRKRILPPDDNENAEEATFSVANGAADLPTVPDNSTAHATTVQDGTIPEGYVPYPQTQHQQQLQPEQVQQADKEPKQKRHRRSRAKVQPVDHINTDDPANASTAPPKNKGGRPKGSKNKHPGAPRAPRKKKEQGGPEVQAEDPATEPQHPPAPVPTAKTSYPSVSDPPGAVAPSNVSNVAAFSAESWVPSSEPIPVSQQTAFVNTTAIVSMFAPATAVEQSPAVTTRSHQTPLQQIEPQPTERAAQLQQQPQTPQQRMEQHELSRSSMPVSDRSHNQGPVPLPTQSQGAYQRVPLPTQSLPLEQAPVQRPEQPTQPESTATLQQQPYHNQPPSGGWQTQSSSSNYPSDILSTRPMNAATTTIHHAKTNSTPPVAHIPVHDHSDFNPSFELPRIVSPPLTLAQPAASSAPTAIRNPASRPQPQTQSYHDDADTQLTGSALQQADTSDYAAVASQATSGLTSATHRPVATPVTTSISTQSQPVQRSMSQSTDITFRAPMTSNVGGRVTPIDATRTSAYAAARDTNASPVSVHKQQESSSYATRATATTYAPQPTPQSYQYSATQQTAPQRQQMRHPSQSTTTSVNSYMPYDDHSFRISGANATGARDPYPVKSASTQGMFSLTNPGSTSQQTPSQATYLPTTTVSQTSTYSAAAHPSVQNITDSQAFRATPLSHDSPITQPTYYAASAAVNASTSSQAFEYTTSATPLTQTANLESSPQNVGPRAAIRKPWSTEEMNALKDRIIMHGPKWALIKHEDERSVSPKLTMRNQQQIKDKAQHIAVMYYQSGFQLPPNFEQIQLRAVDVDRLMKAGINVYQKSAGQSA